MPGVDLASTSAIAEKLRVAIAALSVPRSGAAGSIGITASIGIASNDGGNFDDGPSDLVGAADAALDEAKRTGRNRVCCYHDGNTLPQSGRDAT